MDERSKGALIALRERRDQVIATLSDHFAEDTLELDEYEDRVSRAHQATSLIELDRLVGDLAPIGDRAQGAALVPAPAVQTALQTTRPKARRVVAILGGVERKGQWIAPAETKVTTFMGGVVLDFREALLSPGVTEVKVKAIFGGVEIVVPPHVAVETEGMAILGGFQEMHRVPPVPDPERPLLRISGMALFGGVAVTTRLPGESERDAARRERKEQKKRRKELGKERSKELAAAKRKALKDLKDLKD